MRPALAAAQQPHTIRQQACLLHPHLPGILALRYCSMHLAQYRCRHAMEMRAFLILPAGTARVKPPCHSSATRNLCWGRRRLLMCTHARCGCERWLSAARRCFPAQQLATCTAVDNFGAGGRPVRHAGGAHAPACMQLWLRPTSGLNRCDSFTDRLTEAHWTSCLLLKLGQLHLHHAAWPDSDSTQL
jgi:hypothetical protein